ncbi:unnamed protein product [Owenia fusiformis]|uniref:Uncharacterized protein n=1 Tax=Owenia fusiformis TaxID=6347 RepID=A0A8S4N4Z3_OWEFU|nr:unnamed protein product [Owenia fusiformis]
MMEDTDILKSNLLESPAENDPLIKAESPTLLKLQPLDISPSSLDNYLKEHEKNNLVEKLWREEKYFSDIIALRLQEPDIKYEAPIESDLPVALARSYVRPKRDTTGWNIELDMCWDPMSYSTKHMAFCSKIETWEIERDSSDQIIKIEEFKKHTFAILHSDDKTTLPGVPGIATIMKPRNALDHAWQSLKSLQSTSQLTNTTTQHVNTASHHINTAISNQAEVEKQSKSLEKSDLNPKQQQTKQISSNIKISGNPLDDFLMLRTGIVHRSVSVRPRPEGSASTPGSMAPRSLSTSERAHSKMAPVAAVQPALSQNPQQMALNSKPDASCKQHITADNEGTTTMKQTTTTGKQQNNKLEDLRPCRPAMTKKKSKSKIIDVELTDVLHEVVTHLEDLGKPILSNLHLHGLTSKSTQLTSFTPDMTRFLVKQYEKQQNLGKAKSMECYKNVIALHVLVSGVDVLEHGSLQAATSHMATLLDKHIHTIGGSLENVREYMLKSQYLFKHKHLHHPKLTEVSRQMKQWFINMKLKSPEHDPKVLVISQRGFPTLLQSIHEAVNGIDMVHPHILHNNSAPVSYEQISNCLDEFNCIIISSTVLTSDQVPLAQFSLVLEYEYTENSKWQELCLRQNIRHIGFKTIRQLDKSESLNVLLPSSPAESKTREQYMFIGTPVITENTDLLQLLEARHDIIIVERDFNNMRIKQTDVTCHLHFADILIDERTCVILVTMENLNDGPKLEKLVARVNALRLKFTTCFLILHSNYSQDRKAKYCYAGSTIPHCARLFAAVSHFTSKQHDYEVKIFYSSSNHETATLIRQLGELTCELTRAWNRTEWLDRQWLSEEVTQHERLLLCFPCLNAFSAQILLSVSPLKSLVAMTIPALQDKCPWIPVRMLQMFHRLVNTNSGVIPNNEVKPNHGKILNSGKITNPRPTTVQQDVGKATRDNGTSEKHQEMSHRNNITDLNKTNVSNIPTFTSLSKEQVSLPESRLKTKKQTLETDSPLDVNVCDEEDEGMEEGNKPNEFIKAMIEQDTMSFPNSQPGEEFFGEEIKAKTSSNRLDPERQPMKNQRDLNLRNPRGLSSPNFDIHCESIDSGENTQMGHDLNPKRQCFDRKYSKEFSQPQIYVPKRCINLPKQQDVGIRDTSLRRANPRNNQLTSQTGLSNNEHSSLKPSYNDQLDYSHNVGPQGDSHYSFHGDRNFASRNQVLYKPPKSLPPREQIRGRLSDLYYSDQREVGVRGMDDRETGISGVSARGQETRGPESRGLDPRGPHMRETDHRWVNREDRPSDYIRRPGQMDYDSVSSRHVGRAQPNIRTAETIRTGQPIDVSPPMDLDSDNYVQDSERLYHDRDSMCHRLKTPVRPYLEVPRRRTRVTMTPATKQSKLTFEKVPGRPGGQTRLSFGGP